MRKKSHISLAGYLMNNLEVETLKEHKWAFYFGNILPDIMPSFLTRRHTIDDTFFILEKGIEELTTQTTIKKGMTAKYCRKLGVISHYLADYCTYPHNSIFSGSLMEHCKYEEHLKHSLKAYLKTPEAVVVCKRNEFIYTKEDIIILIERIHEEYLKAKKKVEEDIRYIVELCYQVIDAILQIFQYRTNEILCQIRCESIV